MWQGWASRQNHTLGKGLDSSFSKFERDTFKEECEQYFDQLTASWTSFWYPDCCGLKSAEPEEAPLNHASCESRINDHLLFPTTIALPQEKRKRNRSWNHLTDCNFICMIASDSPRCDLELGISKHCEEEATPMAHLKVKCKMGRVELSCWNIGIILDVNLDPVCLQVLTGKSMSLSQVL